MPTGVTAPTLAGAPSPADVRGADRRDRARCRTCSPCIPRFSSRRTGRQTSISGTGAASELPRSTGNWPRSSAPSANCVTRPGASGTFMISSAATSAAPSEEVWDSRTARVLGCSWPLTASSACFTSGDGSTCNAWFCKEAADAASSRSSPELSCAETASGDGADCSGLDAAAAGAGSIGFGRFSIR